MTIIHASNGPLPLIYVYVANVYTCKYILVHHSYVCTLKESWLYNTICE